MTIYLEQLTLGNWLFAIILSTIGRPVYYFEIGRILRKFFFLTPMLRPFRKVEYQVSDFPGLSFEINRVVLEAAEHIHDQITKEHPAIMLRWRRLFGSERVDLYIKKSVALFSWNLARDYLLLRRRLTIENTTAQLSALDTPLNHSLLPFLMKNYPTPGLSVGGLSRFPSRPLKTAMLMLAFELEHSARMAWSLVNRGFTRKVNRQPYKVSKEILWGIGTGRRNDDFMVNGTQIRASDLLLYHRRGSATREAWPGSLARSLSNANERGYRCINFERIAVPISLISSAIIPRYISFPLKVFSWSICKQAWRPSAALIHQYIKQFGSETIGWEIFSASYQPTLNISLDDPYPGDIAATVGLNLHGIKNGGVQWGDTAWRTMTLSYVGQNVYFPWGLIHEEFWDGNWKVDQFIPTGYIWGHHYEDSRDKRNELRQSLIGNDKSVQFVVSLFDEPSSPETHKSDSTVYDFYRIGVGLLEKRSDTMVIARPKRIGKVSGGRKVENLIAPYLSSGRMQIWDRKKADATAVIAASDVVVSMEMSAPCIEAICCGQTGFNFTPTQNYPSPLYQAAKDQVFIGEVDNLIEAVSHALDHPQENPRYRLGNMMNKLDPFQDCNAINRLCFAINELSEGRSPHTKSEPPVALP